MTTALTGAVELLDRSLAYTRTALAAVTVDQLTAPTPCASWDLAALLAHMDDALDAFTEASTGSLSILATADLPFGAHVVGQPARLASVRAKACALLGWWCEHPPELVRLAGVPLRADLLLGTAALEITVHGWDVHQALGDPEPVPDALARELWPLALATVQEADRPGRFAPAIRPLPCATDGSRLLGFLGRT